MKKYILSFVLLAVCAEALPWGATGHRVTGFIAERYLSKRAHREVKRVLGQESLAVASTWMDEIRSDSTYDYAVDWHWVTIPDGMKYEQAEKNPHGDILEAIDRIVKELKGGGLALRQEQEKLKMLVHLVGDLHMPLHVGRGDDQGGNRVRVKWFRADSNLHRVWDSDMIDDTKLSYTELAMSLGRPDAAGVKKLQSTNHYDWAYESMSYRAQVYTTGDGNLGYRYAYDNLPLVRRRLLEAGVRLAGLLNAIYGRG
jgi:hypothetical protein